MERSLNKILEESFRKNWDCAALSDFKGITLHYRDVARRIEKLHIIFNICGVQKGDRIAICSRNQANWGVVFLASLTYGAVPVPILHEFKPSNVHHIVNHSESRVLFVGDMVWENLSESEMPNLDAIILINDFSLVSAKSEQITDARERLNEMFGKKYPKNFGPADINYHKEESGEELAMINYTSGTSGFSKGVMIPYRALLSNVLFAMEVMPKINNKSNVVSMLPSAHMYGMMFEFLFEMAVGAHVHFLTRIPSPRIIMEAFATVKPDVIISVPLIIEKIYKQKLQPILNKTSMKVLLQLPFIDQMLHDKIKGELVNVFGGNFQEIIIGGAAFNREADEFFNKIGFPYTVGYGMTECGPIISYAPWNNTKLFSCGKPAPRMEVRIASADPGKIPGEIQVRGANVMLGYFKNEEATAEVLTEDGWFRTNDLAIMDEKGRFFIKGRRNNMILGPSGENIYPEEIESVINNVEGVAESIVVERNGRLVALVQLDDNMIEWDKESEDKIYEKLDKYKSKLLSLVNRNVNKTSQVSSVEVMKEPFEKTATQKIRRFKYKESAPTVEEEKKTK